MLNLVQMMNRIKGLALILFMYFSFGMLFATANTTMPDGEKTGIRSDDTTSNRNEGTSFDKVGQAGQKITVKGIVQDQNGEPLPGATIQVKGIQEGTLADSDGRFTIQVPSDAVLVVSFMSMNTVEISVQGKTELIITLKDTSVELSEVVAIGYGSQSRVTVTNSISKVGEEEFKHAPGQNPLLQLQGKVAGMSLQVTSGQPGTAPQVFIRGGTSSSPEGDTPLIIVDGIVSQGMRSIQDMNPDDVESIQVLKDAASTAIYGAKAANGIIIVKTKSGSQGKPVVNIRYTHGIENRPKRLALLNAREYVYLSRYNTQKFNETDPEKFLTGSWGMATNNPRNSENTLEFLDVYLEKYGQAYVHDLLSNQGWETMKDPVTGRQLIFQNNDFQEATFRTGQKKEIDVEVSGGSDKSTFYLGLGYTDQDGTLRGTNYKNYSVLLNNSFKVSDTWTVNSKATLQVHNADGPGNTQNTISRGILMPPTYRMYYEDGTPAPGEGIGSFRSRIHELYYKTKYNDTEVYRTTFQVGAEWKILPSLTFSPTAYYFSAEGIENYFEADNVTTGTTTRPASAKHNFDRHLQGDAVLTFAESFNKKHNVNAVAGTSYNHDYSYRMSGSGSGALTDQIRTLNATADSTQRVSTTKSNEAMLSFFGRVTYDFDKKYIISASLRADGSSRFAEDKQWGYFPGVSAGWNIHRESFFMPMEKIVSRLKLRSSWGMTGNNNISLFDSRGQYQIVSAAYEGEVAVLNNRLKNRDLVWETTTSFDVGLDIGLFHDRVNILVDYYNKLTDDRLFDQPLWNSTGFSSVKSNYGSIRNTGIEIELNTTPIKLKNFTWDLAMTFSYNRSKVEKLPANEEDKNRVGGNFVYDHNSGQVIKVGGIAEGERFGGRWAFNHIGIYQTDEEAALAPTDPNAKSRVKRAGDSKFEDRNGDGILDSKDMVFMGYIRPDRMGGIINTFRYKTLSLRVVMDWAMGHVIDNGFKANMMGSSRNNNNALKEALTNTWLQPNDGAKYPKYTVQSDYDYNYRNHFRWDNQIGNSNGGSNNSLYYGKGDFLAFREISLSYLISTKWVKSMKLNSIEVFAGAYNLGYLTRYDGMTPEIYDGDDYGTYPRPRQYNFGVKVSF